ncbi:MAG: hypothetical protein AVDCRST_MAG56-110 [uncultured Cytophagales bacterium]|uniref:Uncharacterized protein n=1 Tax=uncultured Cytophagales bacterium TaxID=158755 RepID=A0A6J4H5Y3_9SPHI|nr:MAG: hypothetical protein AVDCRST_MAG56-110 [uncultured Cytophagales bacterium]
MLFTRKGLRQLAICFVTAAPGTADFLKVLGDVRYFYFIENFRPDAAGKQPFVNPCAKPRSGRLSLFSE